jgi:hypothetical protein
MLYSGSTLYVGGNLTQAGPQKVDVFAQWHNGAWSGVGGAGVSTSAGFGGTVYAMARNPDTATLYVGGTFAAVGGAFT